MASFSDGAQAFHHLPASYRKKAGLVNKSVTAIISHIVIHYPTFTAPGVAEN